MIGVDSQSLINITIFPLEFFVYQENELFVSNTNNKVKKVKSLQDNQRVKDFNPDVDLQKLFYHEVIFYWGEN